MNSTHILLHQGPEHYSTITSTPITLQHSSTLTLDVEGGKTLFLIVVSTQTLKDYWSALLIQL